MTSRRTGLPPRHLTAVSSRAADARALKSAIARSHTKQADAEAQLQVPPFLMATPPPPADPPALANPPSTATPPSTASPTDALGQKSRTELIAEEAYLRAAGRGFEPGHDLDDWLAAEKLVDARLAGKASS